MTVATKPSRRSSTETGTPRKRSQAITNRDTGRLGVIDWIETHCVFTNAEWIGKPFRLLPWQRQLLLNLFEVGDRGLRRYRWAYISVPKKQGKTELMAALGLYLLIGDEEPSALVYVAAASDEQADLLFGAAKVMCELSPTLSLLTEPLADRILVNGEPNAKLQRVAAAAGTNDGKNVHAVICDELHEWIGTKGEAVWNILTNGTGARRQPMVLQITTAGYDKETICGQQYEHALKVRSGEVDDPTFFPYIVEAPPDADYRDPEVWARANPSYGVTVQEPFYRDQLRKPEAVFRRYFLNQWVEAEQSWLETGMWEACEDKSVDLDPNLPVGVGIDKGQTHDSSAIVIAQKQGDRVVVRCKVWENPYPQGHTLRNDWRVPSEEIRQHLREIHAAYPKPQTVDDYGRAASGPSFAYDPWQMSESAEILAQDRLQMTKFPQTHQFMGPASTQTFELIKGQRLVHDGDPVLSQHVRNATAELTPRGWKVSKPKKSTAKKNDAAVALVMAVSQALLEPPMPREKRKTRLPVGF